jgi:formate dehydrogenase subunit beta
VVPTSAARLLSSLTHRNTGRRIAAVLRSCELRAFLELVKLHQGNVDDVLLIGVDCFGRYENRDYLALAAADAKLTTTFLRGAANGGGDEAANGAQLAAACRACTSPVAEAADLRLCAIGSDPTQQLFVEVVSERGAEAFAALGLAAADPPAGRDAAVAALVAQRSAFRSAHLAAFAERTRDLAALTREVGSCVNCYNCRVACPVCYCRECVFGTDTFRHDGEQYLGWSAKWGELKLPADTLFYHLTRMVHMSTLCVGCGQCSSACPNDVPIWELLSSVAERTQARFDYVPGRSLADGQPLAIFQPEEFIEVTGGQVK